MNRVCVLVGAVITQAFVAGFQADADMSSPRDCEQRSQSDAAVLAQPLDGNATRDQYLRYLLALTRQHLELLPEAVVGDRHGTTTVAVVVEQSGTIKEVSIATPSGYPDIDRRVAQMVEAVRNFPPLPQWYKQGSVRLEMTLRFPDAICN